MKAISLLDVATLTTSRVEMVAASGPHEMVLRLQELGFHQGLQFDYVGRTPLGGPLLFRLDSTVVALRPQEAACLLIRPIL